MQIHLEQISKTFGTRQVLAPLSLTVPSGSFLTLLGPSGCGKTTLLRIISGLETPDSGTVRLGDLTVFDSANRINYPPEKRGLGFVFQDFALWPHMTVFENVAFGLRAAGRTEGLTEKVRKALTAVQLGELEQRFPHQMSGGQQQRVAFARAIVTEPRCILFDEPLSALDARLREDMRHELRELVHGLGITAVFVTHDQAEAISMSDQIAVMNGGIIEQLATPEDLYQKPETEFVARFIGSSNWIDSERMFRPEDASLEEIPGAEVFPVRLNGVEFAGNHYLLHLHYGEEAWVIPCKEKVQTDGELSVYIDVKKIHHVRTNEVKK